MLYDYEILLINVLRYQFGRSEHAILVEEHSKPRRSLPLRIGHMSYIIKV